MYIPIILGTAREGAQSAKVADFVLEEAGKYGFETGLIKVGDHIQARTYRLSDGNSKMEIWKSIVERASGLIIVTPEYNHGYPGELKIFLDSLYKEYKGLVAGLVGVSGGRLGGVRAIENLKPILNMLFMVPTQGATLFSNASGLFDESGKIKDEAYKKRLKSLFDEVKWYAERLKKQ